MRRDQMKIIVGEIVRIIKRSPFVSAYLVGGSWRREEPDPKDIDIALLVNEGEEEQSREWLTDKLDIDLSRVGDTIFSGTLSVKGKKVPIQVWQVNDPKYWGGLQVWVTGSGAFNRNLAVKAARQGMKFSMYGLFAVPSNFYIGAEDEEGIFNSLDMEYVQPKDRAKGTVIGQFKATGYKPTAKEQKVADVLKKIGDKYKEEGETFKANAFYKTSKVARSYPHKEWPEQMGKSGLEEAEHIWKTGKSTRL